jgi:hypothetical protein
MRSNVALAAALERCAGGDGCAVIDPLARCIGCRPKAVAGTGRSEPELLTGGATDIALGLGDPIVFAIAVSCTAVALPRIPTNAGRKEGSASFSMLVGFEVPR